MTIRLFAALAMPDEIAEPLLAQQQGVPGAKWRTREHLHQTTSFAACVKVTAAVAIGLGKTLAVASGGGGAVAVAKPPTGMINCCPTDSTLGFAIAFASMISAMGTS
jgi:hypothetical protein